MVTMCTFCFFRCYEDPGVFILDLKYWPCWLKIFFRNLEFGTIFKVLFFKPNIAARRINITTIFWTQSSSPNQIYRQLFTFRECWSPRHLVPNWCRVLVAITLQGYCLQRPLILNQYNVLLAITLHGYVFKRLLLPTKIASWYPWQ